MHRHVAYLSGPMRKPASLIEHEQAMHVSACASCMGLLLQRARQGLPGRGPLSRGTQSDPRRLHDPSQPPEPWLTLDVRATHKPSWKHTVHTCIIACSHRLRGQGPWVLLL